MGLLLAPYNNAMRLGQGFNSYTQEICIDDAVITDPGRPLNQLTNDGTTMADLRIMMQGPSAYSSIKQALTPSAVDEIPITGHNDAEEGGVIGPGAEKDEDTAAAEQVEDDDEPSTVQTPPSASIKAASADSDDDGGDGNTGDDEEEEGEKTGSESENEGNDDENAGDGADEEGAGGKTKPDAGGRGKLTPEQRRQKAAEKQKAKQKAEDEEKERKQKEKDAKDDKQRALARAKAEKEEQERYKAAEKRAREAATIRPHTKAERDAWLGKDHSQTPSKALSASRGERTRQYVYKPGGARGPSQIVTYSSRFVEKLSDITDDMNISGALSIKYGTIGGSGRGAFVNSDKFHDSDLNFYISVKVINQTTNMKDALVYQPLRSVNASNFREVYGDCFISGFLEGGEFNAIISMKVLNKSAMTKIKAEAKVALTVGVADISAEAAVDIAKKNIMNNAETTIQVSWSGGGFIKPMDEPWDIESLMSAAARFPDLVAITPQRTYAILTKYESLRSFVKLQPAAFSPMQYECAQLYTNMLLDTYMDYKAILKKLSSDIFDVENGISLIKENPRSLKVPGGNRTVGRQNGKRDVDEETPFETSLSGLDRARRACRFQMVRIVNEVDEITKDPKKATDEDRVEPFQPPRVFKDRLPLVKPIVAAPANPLSNERIKPGPDRRYGPLCAELSKLEDEERVAVMELTRERPDVARYFRLAKPVGSAHKGTPFNDLEFLKHSVSLSSVAVGVARGIVTYLQVQYSNGLQCFHGCRQEGTKGFTLDNLRDGERIIACSVETGEEGPPPSGTGAGVRIDPNGTQKPKTRVTRLKLFTNRGRSLIAQADGIDEKNLKQVDRRDERQFHDLHMDHFDPVMEMSYIKGFWGYSENGLFGVADDGLWRVGVIWGNDLKPEPRVVDEDDELVDQGEKNNAGKKNKGGK